MDDAIKNICQALKEEAEAVIKYTDRATKAYEDWRSGNGSKDTFTAFAGCRLDAIDHIQTLTIALTKVATDDDDDSSEGGEDE